VELPPALFSDVTGQNALSTDPHDDRGRIANWVFLGQRTALMRGEDAVAPSMIRRLSIQGIGLLHVQPIPVGEEFTLLLPRQAGRQAVPVLCKAVRCEEGATDGLYRVGAVFMGVLCDEYAAAALPERIGVRPIRAATLAA
jgi:hypothetical protein